jgi:hypothetical protein
MKPGDLVVIENNKIGILIRTKIIKFSTFSQFTKNLKIFEILIDDSLHDISPNMINLINQ